MAATVAAEVSPDKVISFEIMPGTYRAFRDLLAEGGPRLKCVRGSVTLVSPGRPHEAAGNRLASLILAVASVIRVPHTPLSSTTWELPEGALDTGYEADESYYVQSHGKAEEGYRPDLAVEVVVTNPEKHAKSAGALLGIPELWVLDVTRHRLTFYHLVARGKAKGSYRADLRSRAFPFLKSDEVQERLDDPEKEAVAFHENCRSWAEQVLLPRHRGPGKNA